MSLRRAEILLQTRRFDDAERALHEALRENPQDPRAHRLLARIHLERKQTAQARHEVEEAIRLDPQDAMAFVLLAAVEQQDGHEHAAADAAHEARHRAPTWAEPLNVLARHAAGRERWVEALALSEEALTLEPDNADAAGLRAWSLTHLGRRNEATEAADRNLAQDPQDPHAHMVRGMTLLHRGRPKEAKAAFREALRLDPGNAAAAEGLVLSLKASSLALRPVFAFFFWMARMPPRLRMGLILGAWMLAQGLDRLADAHPALRPFVLPLVIAYGVFCLATWVADPVMNLALRLHPDGRHALSSPQRRGGTVFGAGALLALLCLAGSFTALPGHEMLLTSAIGFLLAGVFAASGLGMAASAQRGVVLACAAALGVAAPLAWGFEAGGFKALSGLAILTGALAAIVAFFAPLTRNLTGR